jgi:cell division protein FtsA
VPRSSILVGLDIGTTKVACIVGELNPKGGIDVVGIGTHPSTGLRKGVVINIEDTVRSIAQAVEEAEMMAGVQVSTVYAGIAGGHIKSLNSHGTVPVRTGLVAEGDVEKVLETAQALAIPMDREVVHVIPQEYTVDDQDGIQDPRGMAGVRLSAKVHVVTAAVSAAQNIVRCCNMTGLNVRDVVLQPLASADAVLTRDEKQLGVMLVDIGGGTTDVAIFVGGAVVHTHVLAIGGDHLTNDIAYGLKAPIQVAERIKQEQGCAVRDLVKEGESFDVPHVGGDRVHQCSRADLADIIEPRVSEMFGLVKQELERSGFADRLPAGVVLTGGTTLLPGMTELAERVFDTSARRGVPREVGGLADVVANPIFATGVGLVKFGALHGRADDRYKRHEPGLVERVRSRVSEWLGLAV